MSENEKCGCGHDATRHSQIFEGDRYACLDCECREYSECPQVHRIVNPPAPATATVGIYRCPRHPAFWSVAVDDTRITPSKCCGTWDLVKEWKGVKVTHGY